MTTFKEQREARLEQALKDMGNMGVKQRRPEDQPFYDQPSEFELEMERKRFASVETEEEESENSQLKDTLQAKKRKKLLEAALKQMEDYGTGGIAIQRTAFFDPPDDVSLEESEQPEATPEEESSSENRKTEKEEVPHRANRAKNKDRGELALFQEKYLQPLCLSHRKAIYVSEETQRRLSFIVRKIGEQGASISGYVEQVLREHLDQCKEKVEKWRKL